MPVLSMHEASWEDTREMLSNAQEMTPVRQNMVSVPAGAGAVRSQDDARVGYMFQRPPPQAEMMQQMTAQQQYVNKPWLGGERGLEQVTTIV